MYRKRNEVERLFRRLKGFRRIFSRFEKLDVIFLRFVYFALIVEALDSYLVLTRPSAVRNGNWPAGFHRRDRSNCARRHCEPGTGSNARS